MIDNSDDFIWEHFKKVRKKQQAKKTKRRVEFAVLYKEGSLEGWAKCHETHYQTTLLGDVLDYWPGPRKWSWRGKTMTGDVFAFIQKHNR